MTRLTVIAGPTAVGKGTVVRYLIEHHPEIRLSVSVTTRPPRPDEIDGVHYFFVSDEEFDRMIAANELLEHAVVHLKHRYGTPRKPVEEALANNKQIILEIDVQGARQVKNSLPSANLIFLAPPSMAELEKRLIGRGTESEEQIAIRLATAALEMAAMAEFDHVVVNHEVAQAAQEVLELMQG
ncbi:MAG: guanylate kinase [Acidobacteria bacterium]|nr:guanylate kinase [Acidobacteriota bacterium]